MNTYEQIAALREAGKVQRCHTYEYTGRPYTVATHCYNVTLLLIKLHEAPSRELLTAALFHDSAEAVTGDVPAPAKWNHPSLAILLKEIEELRLKELGVYSELTDDESFWLKGADLIELYCWVIDEIKLGNKTNRIIKTAKAVEKVLHDKRDLFKLPTPLWDYFLEIKLDEY